MGVPKFYRWLSERYPQINQLVSDSTLLPEFDNLYLDMNGILHGCTHPNNDAVSASLSERDVFLGVFHYIDRIVSHIVRPKKVLYMAIDGVAPRAKMNQQRSRRFRSAKDAAEARAQMEAEGEELPPESEVFDSNCITPGTVFMAKVSRHLRYFIRKKIKEDPLWASLEITFSGHEVPGEGEHKIMQFIRDERAAGRLDPNTRHCMYGQDADLIMLGLISHEPHFTLLREVVDFGAFARGAASKNSVKIVMRNTRDAAFQLLHLSILRDYLWSELTVDMSPERAASANLERWIDDFVFITFLIGNDFLPHMPSLDIGEEAFDLLFTIYRSQFNLWGGGYLTENGSISDPDRLEGFLAAIGDLEDEIFSEREVNEAKFRARRRKAVGRSGGGAHEPSEEELESAKRDEQTAYEIAVGALPGSMAADWKGRYYYTKFGIAPRDEAVHHKLRVHYIEGLQWCLAYYYKGCISWSWFYPFHYVPMISDLKDLKSLIGGVSFTLGAPFSPFQQLISCLPPASSWCLPSSYAGLMTHPESPILDFYPTDFKIDANGKRNPWEAVNLLPFIDAQRMFEAVEQWCPTSKLSAEEVQRNSFGNVYVYRADPNATGTVMSCNPEIGLRDITHCGSTENTGTWTIESTSSFTSKLREGVTIPLAGFPTLHNLKIISVDVKPIKVNVFGSDSRYRTMVLRIQEPTLENVQIEELAKLALGRSVFVNWPLAHEARVVAVSNCEKEVRFGSSDGPELKIKEHDPKSKDMWLLRSQIESAAYTKGRSVPGSGGALIGQIHIRLSVLPLQGMSPELGTGALRKVFGTQEAEVPLQMVMWQSPAVDPRFEECGPQPVSSLLPIGSHVLCLGCTSHRGCKAIVKDHGEEEQVTVEVQIRPSEPPFGINIASSVTDDYIPAHEVVRKVGLRSDVLGKVFGSLVVNPGRYDIGLNLKANGRFYTQGYTRPRYKSHRTAWARGDTVKIIGSLSEDQSESPYVDPDFAGWEFSPQAVQLVLYYMQQFPVLFQSLATVPNERSLSATDIFGPGRERMLEGILQFLESLPTSKSPRTPLTTSAIAVEAARAIERAADVRQRLLYGRMTGTETIVISAKELVKFNSIDHTHAPRDESHDTGAKVKGFGGAGGVQPLLGDRIVNICARGVPFGMWGTVVALHRHSACVDVIFDEEFIGGGTLQGICSNYRGALVPWAAVARIEPSISINIVQRVFKSASAVEMTRTPSLKPLIRHHPEATEFTSNGNGIPVPPPTVPLSQEYLNYAHAVQGGSENSFPRPPGQFESDAQQQLKGILGLQDAGAPLKGSCNSGPAKHLPGTTSDGVHSSPLRKGKKYQQARGPDEGMKGFLLGAGRGRGSGLTPRKVAPRPGGLSSSPKVTPKEQAEAAKESKAIALKNLIGVRGDNPIEKANLAVENGTPRAHETHGPESAALKSLMGVGGSSTTTAQLEAPKNLDTEAAALKSIMGIRTAAEVSFEVQENMEATDSSAALKSMTGIGTDAGDASGVQETKEATDSTVALKSIMGLSSGFTSEANSASSITLMNVLGVKKAPKSEEKKPPSKSSAEPASNFKPKPKPAAAGPKVQHATPTKKLASGESLPTAAAHESGASATKTAQVVKSTTPKRTMIPSAALLKSRKSSGTGKAK